jgi:hypothetical protein
MPLQELYSVMLFRFGPTGPDRCASAKIPKPDAGADTVATRTELRLPGSAICGESLSGWLAVGLVMAHARSDREPPPSDVPHSFSHRLPL